MSHASTPLYSLYKKELSSFDKHLEAAHSAENERIHKLRVDIKNIRALLELSSVASGEKKKHKKILRLLRPLFKTGGKVRAGAMNLGQVKAYKGRAFDAYKDSLKKQKREDIRFFKKEVRNFDRDMLHKGLKRAADHKAPHFTKAVRDHIRSLFVETGKLLPGFRDDALFHEVRKLLKKIKVIHKLLKGLPEQGDLGWVAGIEEKIGKWHDGVTLLESLERFISTHKDLEDLRVLSRFISLLDKSNRRIKAQIVGLLKRRLAQL